MHQTCAVFVVMNQWLLESFVKSPPLRHTADESRFLSIGLRLMKSGDWVSCILSFVRPSTSSAWDRQLVAIRCLANPHNKQYRVWLPLQEDPLSFCYCRSGCNKKTRLGAVVSVLMNEWMNECNSHETHSRQHICGDELVTIVSQRESTDNRLHHQRVFLL